MTTKANSAKIDRRDILRATGVALAASAFPMHWVAAAPKKEQKILYFTRSAGFEHGAVKVKDVEIALKRLQQLGLIRKDESGRWEQSDPILSTGPEVKSLLITNFHREMMRLAETSITEHPSEERDITALTLSIHQSRIAELKLKIAAFRKEILNEFSGDDLSDQVIQINFQAFLLTKSKIKGDRS